MFFLEFIFDNELRPLKNVSLFEVQCKLNQAGAVGKEKNFFLYFYYLNMQKKLSLKFKTTSNNIILKKKKFIFVNNNYFL